jgi:hypothetical protein
MERPSLEEARKEKMEPKRTKRATPKVEAMVKYAENCTGGSWSAS